MKKAVLLSFLLCLALACTACAGGDMQPSPTPDAPTEAPQDANLPQLPEDIRVDQNGVPVLNVYVQSEDKIDEMGLEEYLCGVLAGEMKNDWPEEALKAQAILARTFVLKFLMEKKSMYEGADISTDIREAQAYDAEGVNERIRAAVKDTRGMVVCYQNEPIYAWFHAHSGGKTDTAENGLDYQQAAPYTQVTDGNESESAPQDAARWSTQFTEAEVIQAAADAGLKLDGGIETVQAGAKDDSGRVGEILLNGQPVSANEFRITIGSTKMKSTLLTHIAYSDGTLALSGRGYGHGVGMPQWGAYAWRKMAKRRRKSSITISKLWILCKCGSSLDKKPYSG